MKLKLLPPTMGLLWMKDAYRTFKAYPKVFFTLFGACYLLAVLVFIGSSILAALGILCSIAMMVATHDLLQGNINPKSPAILDVFSKLLRHGNTVILILLYTFCFFLVQSLVQFLCTQITPDFYTQYLGYVAALRSSEKTPPEILLQAYPHIIAMQALLLIMPYLILFPFFCMSPALVFWGGVSPAKSMVFNFIAFIKNKRTWLIFIISWTCITLLSVLLALIVFTLCSLLFGKAGIALGTLLALIAVILFCAIGSAVMSASLYYAYHSCFIMHEK